MRTYRLKLSDKVVKFLKRIKRQYKVKLSVADIQEYNIKAFDIPEAAGYFFVVNNQKHIYVNNKQHYKNSHDLIVLHEIGHLLMHEYSLYEHMNQEESFANGYAIAKASEMGLPISENMIMEMCKYSAQYYETHKQKKKRIKRK